MKELKQRKAYAKYLKPLVPILIALALFLPAVAGQGIHLESRTITPDSSAVPEIDGQADSRQHFIVQLNSSAEEQRQHLESQGVELLEYVPENAWYASAPTDKIQELGSSEDVRAVVTLRNQDKFSDSITDGLDRGVKGDKVTVTVEVFEDVEKKEAGNALERHGEKVSEQTDNRYRVTVEKSQQKLNQLAAEDGVKWVEELPPEPEASVDDSRSLINVDTVQKDFDFTGKGLTGAVWDGGLAGDHEDLTYDGKRIKGDSASINGHATHVAGVMLGGGKKNDNNRGMAPDADLATYKWPTSSTSELYQETEDAVSHNAVVSQNSWGWSANSYSDMGEYGSFSRAYDAIINGDKASPISVVFSAGNEGNDGWQSRYDTLTGAGGTAKNTITAGAVSDDGSMTSFSSWGPTDDGRIKPDVVANGVYVTSTVPGNSYGTKSGTSISSPAVSGAVILLNDAYKQETGELPSPATVKATLIHTANDIESEGPDYRSGWGVVDMESAVDLVKNGNIERGTLSDSSDSKTYNFNVDSGGKFTLVWSDHPASTSASKTLVNDLELVVKDSNGNRYYPYKLDPSDPSGAATKGEDHRNPVEQVELPDDFNGEVTVTVKSENLPEPAQKYTLVTQSNEGSSSPEPQPPEITVESPVNREYDKTPQMAVKTDRKADVTYQIGESQEAEMNRQSDTYYTASPELGDGQYTVTFEATADSETTTASRTFTINSSDGGDSSDTTPPEITINSPESKTYSTSEIKISMTADEQLSRAVYSLDSDTRSLEKQNGNYVDTATVSDGDHTAKFYAKDEAGNLQTKKLSFSVDTSSDDGGTDDPDAPMDITVESPEDRTYSTGTVELRLSANKPLDNVYTKVDHRGISRMDMKNGDFVHTANNLDNGDHKVWFQVEDAEGNWYTKTKEFSVDKSSDGQPSINLDLKEPSGIYSSKQVPLKFDTNAENIWYRLDAGTKVAVEGETTIEASEGSHHVELIGETDGKTVTEASSFTVELEDSDNTPPEITVHSPELRTYEQGEVRISMSASEQLSRAVYSLDGEKHSLSQEDGRYVDTVNLEDGQHTVEFYVKDKAGNLQTKKVSFSVDTSSNDGPSDGINFQVDFTDGTDPVPVQWKLSNGENRYTGTGQIDIKLENDKWDLVLKRNSNEVMIGDVEIDQNTKKEILWKEIEPEVNGYKVGNAVALSGDMEFQTAEVNLPYSDLNNPDMLYCTEWSASCSGSWERIKYAADVGNGDATVYTNQLYTYAVAEKQ